MQTNNETVEAFLKRGGKITKIPTGVGVGFKPSNTIAGHRRKRERTRKVGDVLEFGTDPHKLVRRDGMDTSRDAANEVCTTKLEAEVYMVIKAAGRAGMISDEVRRAMPHVTSYSSVTARYKSLKEKGLIVATDGRRKGSSGRNQAVMVACCHIPVPF